jgi:mannose-1-phosphate guanylyltransferase
MARAKAIILGSGSYTMISQIDSRPPARAMILCAGLGHRLRPLTLELPKPAIVVGDRSVLAHIATRLAREGYREALANTHYLPEKIRAEAIGLDVTLTLIHEPEIRGVAGAIAGARPGLAPPVLVWNGDILIEEPPVSEIVALAERTGGVCLAIAPNQRTGIVGLDAANRIVRLRGETHGREVASGDYVGLCAFGAEALAELPERGCLIGDYCLPRLRRGEPVYACAASGPWWDIGSLGSYLGANRHWLAAGANHAERSFVHGSAEVGPGVTLVDSIVGPRARVSGAGLLSGCVIWADAHAVAPLADTVVTPRHVVALAGEPRP